ncbi:hypothetical protein MIND_00214700 [Mycena indigotica]|uniref:Uncharacterized protein n=1 Tax=Mycena indigotica TaxID=2126181 RepID=A0A8H6T8Q9_9AGAR|nr:uncharacterized protein MIND_00214700 [Mycena indigotica]KAF7312027.1 hypothetical protein MIND_00214700 [Mycena indigotica]
MRRLSLVPVVFSACTRIPLMVNASVVHVQQRTVTPAHGTITSPQPGTPITNAQTGGEVISFGYTDSNWCHDGYSDVSVWLLNYAPNKGNINNTTGRFDDAVHQFGAYSIGNFGLPPKNPPPTTLSMPALTSPAYAPGASVYIAVVETATSCPPGNNIPPQYGTTSVELVIA